jgi:tryptophan synthase beta chain
VRYSSIGDDDAVAALEECAAVEGVIPALESAHAMAGARRVARERPGATILVGLSGRGDKDLGILDGLREAEERTAHE